MPASIKIGIENARAFLAGQGVVVDRLAKELDGKFVGTFVRANKPATGHLRPVGAK